MIGNVGCWFLQIWYIIVANILSKILELTFLAEIATFIKLAEFAIIPAVRIFTSPAFKRTTLESPEKTD